MPPKTPLQKDILFSPAGSGYANYRIPGLLVTRRGVVLASAEARGGTGGDWDDSDILLRRSPDGGRNFEPARKIVSHELFGCGAVNNFGMVEDGLDGAVHALFCHRYERVFSMRSEDDGATFSEPQEITPVLAQFRAEYPWRVVALGPGHALQLRGGRILIPIWMSDGTGTEFGPGLLGHRPSLVSLIYSDDHGASWQRGEIVCRHGEGEIVNPSESVLVELADGRVLMNIRSESAPHRRLVSISPDGVRGWSRARFDPRLFEPVCMAGLIRHSWPEAARPGAVLFSNPVPLEEENSLIGVSRPRKRLMVRLSQDDCATWAAARVIEEGPAGYSDLAVLPNGEVLCLYERGEQENMYDPASLCLARFPLEWLR